MPTSKPSETEAGYYHLGFTASLIHSFEKPGYREFACTLNFYKREHWSARPARLGRCWQHAQAEDRATTASFQVFSRRAKQAVINHMKPEGRLQPPRPSKQLPASCVIISKGLQSCSRLHISIPSKCLFFLASRWLEQRLWLFLLPLQRAASSRRSTQATHSRALLKKN